jgi:hypothetical protein
VDTTTLVMLWTTHPRMAWLAVLLVPYQARGCSCTFRAQRRVWPSRSSCSVFRALTTRGGKASTILTQPSGWGRVPEFGRAVQLMYGGALLWLLVLVACLAMLGNSLLAVDTVMNALVGFASLDVRAGKEALA